LQNKATWTLRLRGRESPDRLGLTEQDPTQTPTKLIDGQFYEKRVWLARAEFVPSAFGRAYPFFLAALPFFAADHRFF
jgi:hypothetical protein